MGNLDPVHVVMETDAESVRAEARRCLDVFGGGKAFILSGGCALPDATPLDNTRAMVLAAKGAGRGGSA